MYFRDLDTGLVSTAEEFLAAPPKSDSDEIKPLVIRFLRSLKVWGDSRRRDTLVFCPIVEVSGIFRTSRDCALLTNLFAVGTSFAMVVYNRIIPSNALSSLLVLWSAWRLVDR